MVTWFCTGNARRHGTVQYHLYHIKTMNTSSICSRSEISSYTKKKRGGRGGVLNILLGLYWSKTIWFSAAACNFEEETIFKF